MREWVRSLRNTSCWIWDQWKKWKYSILRNYIFDCLQNLFVLLKSKIARMTLLFSVNYAVPTTFDTYFVIINSRVQWLCFLQTFATNWRFQVITWKKTRTTLITSQAKHSSFRLPTSKNTDHQYTTFFILEPQLGHEISLCCIPQFIQEYFNDELSLAVKDEESVLNLPLAFVLVLCISLLLI